MLPPHNAWRVTDTERLAFLVDSASYYRAFAHAALRAERAIYVTGWDLDSRTPLWLDAELPELPHTLGEFLVALTRRRPELEVYLLPWDWAMIYVGDRELAPLLGGAWRRCRRIHYHTDGRHPVGAAHHQKLVVVDDRLAFTGGMDLALWRWDTPAHRADDPRRVDPTGKPYQAVHDVQVAVDGPAARALGSLFRTRWQRAAGQRLTPVERDGDPWPADLPVDLADAAVGLCRTLPAWQGQPEAREIERLYLDGIAAAREHIYLENQYLTSHAVGAALARRLAEPDGPEVVYVGPEHAPGWLEESTMGVLRARLAERLREADAHDRLQLYHPTVPGLGDGMVYVHSKLMAVDDRLVLVGTANLSNRSLGLDSELAVAVEAEDGDVRAEEAIAGLRARLLGEHLDVRPDEFAVALRQRGSLAEAIEHLRGGARTLCPLDTDVPEWLDRLVPVEAVVDPEAPVDPETLARQLLPAEAAPASRGPLWRATVVLAGLVALAAAWRFTPLGDWLSPDRIAALAASLAGTGWLPVAVVGGFVAATLLMVPITLLVLACGVLFSTGEAFAYAYGSTLLGALLGFGLGRLVGREALRRVAGRRLRRVSRWISRRGIRTALVVRLLPTAPFTVVNLVAGASGLGWRDFTVGTALGAVPGTLALTVFGGSLVEAIRAPGVASLAVLAGVTLALLLGVLWMRRVAGEN